MNVVEYIQDNLDPLVVLNHYGFKHLVETDENIRACCEIHKGNNPTAFIWNKSNNLWFCYTGDCGGGDVFTLVQKMDNVDFTTAVRKTAKILDLDISGLEFTSNRDHILHEQKKWIELQRRRRSHTGCVEEYSLPFTRYYTNHETFKRFPEVTLEYYSASFCNLYPTINSMLYNKLVIPIFQDEKIVGVALRDTSGTFIPKWFYQPTGLKINSLLYNIDYITKNSDSLQEVILVEGIFDVWAYHEIGIDNVVAIFGSSLKDEQYKQLLKLPLNIVMSFDNDDAGRKCARETAKKFRNKTQVYNIELPDGKDPGDCTQDELLDVYLKRKLYKQE
jgi:DNA primase